MAEVIKGVEALLTWLQQSQAVVEAVDATGATAGYVVAESCCRQGIGSSLCKPLLHAALRLGFWAMQSTWWGAAKGSASAAGSTMGFRWGEPCGGRSASCDSGARMACGWSGG